jgi:hypothetical protein
MPVPVPAPHVPPGFSPMATPGCQTAQPGSQTAPGIEVDSPTTSPGGQTAPGTEAGSLTARPGGQTAHETEAGDPTATPGGQIATPYTTTSSPALPTSATPHAAPTTLPVSRATLASTTSATPPTTPTSQLYLQHYSCRPRAAREPPAPPLHQQLPPAKAIPVAPPVDPHLMTMRVKRGF